MTNEIAIVNFTDEQIKLIKSQIAPKATNDELQLFLYQAKRTGLDPLTRQIYAIHRNVKEKEFGKDVWKQKMTIQTSIDGFRVIAERSGDYAGQDEPIFNEQDGKLISCKITVYRFRGDTRYPAAVGVAYWEEYAQTDNQGNLTTMWKKMPRTMLAKVAEALALRKAYPQDLSGLYTNDEMTQADEPKEPVNVTPETKAAEQPKDKNSSGISKELVQASDEDMKEILNKKNEQDFTGLKQIIENCGGLEELQKVWTDKENAKIINSLKKWRPELYDKLVDAKDYMKSEFSVDSEEYEFVGSGNLEK